MIMLLIFNLWFIAGKCFPKIWITSLVNMAVYTVLFFVVIILEALKVLG